jgi:hypothetical protein
MVCRCSIPQSDHERDRVVAAPERLLITHSICWWREAAKVDARQTPLDRQRRARLASHSKEPNFVFA